MKSLRFALLILVAALAAPAATLPVPRGSSAAAIQAIINGSASGDTIYFQAPIPPAAVETYSISTTLSLLNNRTYQCAGAAATTIRGTGSYALMITPNDATAGITVTGCNLDGGGIYLPGTLGVATNVTITYNTIQNVGAGSSDWTTQTGVFAGAGINGGVIAFNTFRNIFSQNNRVSANLPANAIRGWNFRNTSITDNTFDQVNQGISVQFTSSLSYPGVVIARNIGTGVHRMGIETQGSGTTNFLVENNIFTAFLNPFYDTFCLSIVVDGGTDTVVRNNSCDATPGSGYGYGIEVGGIRTQVTGNTVKDAFITGIAIGGGNTRTITGNLLCGSAGAQLISYESGIPVGSDTISGNTQQLLCPPAAPPAPDLTITKSHTANFTQGSPASYTIQANNIGGSATSGTVNVTDIIPTGLTATAISGSGWTCALTPMVSCTRSDALLPFASYPAITLTVSVASTAPASVTNRATVTGGGQTNTTNDTASDVTAVGQLPPPSTISNLQVSATATQAVISFDVTDPTTCLLVVSTDAGFAASVNDTNTTLYPGSQNCDRASSSVSGTRVIFVAGARTSKAASDGLFYSRALESNRVHYLRITAGSAIFTCDPTANCIQTTSPAFGNTYPEPPPFDAAAPYNYAWPTIRPALDRNKAFIDPMTGTSLMPITGPSQAINGLASGNHSGVNGSRASDFTSTWTNPGNGAVIDAVIATNSAANQNTLFVRDTRYCIGGATVQAQGSSFACVTGQWGFNGSDQTNIYTMDDYKVQIRASGSGATTTMQYAVTGDGVTPLTAWQYAAVTGSLADTVFPSAFPSTLNGGTTFGAWSAARIPFTCLTVHTGTATVTGTALAWASGEHFAVDCLAVGSYITLGATDYRVTAVNSPNSLTIASPPANGTYNFWQFNLGVLIGKQTSSAGSLNVDGVKFTDYESANFTSPLSGIVRFVAPSTLTDSSSVAGRLAILFEGFDRWIYFIEEATGKARFLGGGLIQSCFVTTCAAGVTNAANEYVSGQPATWFSFNTQNPRHFYGNTTDVNGKQILIDQFYDNTHGGDCPGDYTEITPSNCTTYPVNKSISQNNATPAVNAAGADKTLISQMTAYNTAQRAFHPEIPIFDASKFGAVQPNVADYVNGWQSITVYAGQDTFGWTAWFDPAASFNLVAMTNSYANGIRFASIHGTGSLGGYQGLSSNILTDAQTGVGRGRFILRTVTSTDNTTQNVCSGLAAPWDAFNGLARCYTLALSGADPCHDTPNLATETAPMYGACGWNAAYTHLAGVNVAIGDLLDDTSGSGEMFRVVAASGLNITVLRAYGTPATATGQNARQSSLAAHTQPWFLRELASNTAGNNGGQSWVNLNLEPNGLAAIVDYPTLITGHADFSEFGASAEPNRYRVYSSFGAMIGAPNSFNANEAGPFGTYLSGGTGWLQSHVGLSRDQANPNYTIDKNPLSLNSGASNTLWNQTANLVSGSLWHIAAANVQKDAATPWPGAIKSVPYVMWSGGYLLQDVSGPASAIVATSTDNWKFCVVYKTGECVGGSAVGDVYANIPQSAHDGKCGPWDYTRNICGTTLDAIAGGLNQYWTAGIAIQTNATDGRTYRRLSSVLNRLNFESVFSSGAADPNGQWAFGHADFYNGLRSDLFIAKLPPAPAADNVARNDFGAVAVVLPSNAAPNARIRFGYAENGTPGSFYCAYNRKEACYTIPLRTTSTPYYFAGDAGQTYQACSTGCTINIPAIPGRLVYYMVDRLDSGGVVLSSGALQVAPFQAPAAAFSACDLNLDRTTNVLDVQLGVNMNLGIIPCTANINGAGVCTVPVIARVVAAALGGICTTGP